MHASVLSAQKRPLEVDPGDGRARIGGALG